MRNPLSLQHNPGAEVLAGALRDQVTLDLGGQRATSVVMTVMTFGWLSRLPSTRTFSFEAPRRRRRPWRWRQGWSGPAQATSRAARSSLTTEAGSPRWRMLVSSSSRPALLGCLSGGGRLGDVLGGWGRWPPRDRLHALRRPRGRGGRQSASGLLAAGVRRPGREIGREPRFARRSPRPVFGPRGPTGGRISTAATPERYSMNPVKPATG